MPILLQLIKEVKELAGLDLSDQNGVFQRRKDEDLETTNKEIVPAINELNSIVNPFTITSYTVNNTVFEMGSSNEVVLRWTCNENVKSQTINNETLDNSLRSKSYSKVTNNTTYVLNCVSTKDVSRSKSLSINFYNGIYYGVSSNVNYSAGLIGLFPKTLSNSKSRTINVNAATGQYIYYCLPSRLGVPTFNVGGFEGGFSLVSTVNFTNPSGYTEKYDIYKGTNSGLGITTVVIS